MNDRINEHYYGDLREPQTVRCRDRIHWICRQVQGAKILDIGCSQGVVCLILAREGFHCTGVDIDPASLDYARLALAKESELVRERIVFQLADASALPFADDSFDTVILGEVLEHLTHPARILREARRVLRENGRIIVTVPHGLNAYPDHKNSYYPMSLLRCLQCFFKTESVGTMDGYITYCGSHLSAYDVAQVSPLEMLEHYQRLETDLELRCLAKEQALLETAARLYARQNSQVIETAGPGKLGKSPEEVSRAAEGRAIDPKAGAPAAPASPAPAGATLAAQAVKNPITSSSEPSLQESAVRIRHLECEIGKLKEDQRFLTQIVDQANLQVMAVDRKAGSDLQRLTNDYQARIDAVQESSKRLEATATALQRELHTFKTEHEARLAQTDQWLGEISANVSEETKVASEACRDQLIREMQRLRAEMLGAQGLFDAALNSSDTALRALRVQVEQLDDQLASRADGYARLRRELQHQLEETEADLHQAWARTQTEWQDQLNTVREGTDAAWSAKYKALQDLHSHLAQDLAAKEKHLADVIEKAKSQWQLSLDSKSKELEAKLGQLAQRTQESVSKATSEWQAKLLAQQRAQEADASHFRNALQSLAPVEQKCANPANAAIKRDEEPSQNGAIERNGANPLRSASRALGRILRLHQRNGQSPVVPPPATRPPQEGKAETRLVEEIKAVLRAMVPSQAKVLVISKGDDCLVDLPGHVGWHFPQNAAGVYAGYHPANSEEAIAHLEQLRAKGAAYLLIPVTAFWWLEFYSDLCNYLESRYRLLAYREETCVIFALSAPAEGNHSPVVISTKKAPVRNGNTHSQPKPANQSQPEAAKLTLQTGGTTFEAKHPSPNRSSGTTNGSRKPSKERERTGLTVGGILDEFTAACFRPECNLITFRPDNWRNVLERNPLDMLLVESAWQGNGGSWQYKIASFKKPMGEELVEVVDYCKSRGIPTVFWNKEDPSHFDRFIHRASLFDCVFTTDADMIPKYRAIVKHDRVFALPFAAQPKLHNPILEADRAHNVCFAGAYYALEHDERRADIDHILRPALPLGLHIYDRQHGVVGANAAAYQFPEIYRPAIKGRLEYDAMVKAYKQYRVFLNVNSVKHSPTMFSRRVFELLASGTPVVSSYAKGITELLGTDIVHLAQSEVETSRHLERLVNDPAYWSEISVKGIREVFSRHTYGHRFAEICQKAGLPVAADPSPRVGAVARVETNEQVRRLTGELARQTYRDLGLTLVTGNAVKSSEVELLKRSLPDTPVRVLPSTTDLLRCLSDDADRDYVWLINLDDSYGQNFLKDAAIGATYSGADVIGKHTHYEQNSASATAKLCLPGHEHKYVKSVSPGSLLAKPDKLTSDQWRAIAANKSIVLPNLRVLSIDRFNYVRYGSGLNSFNGSARSGRG